MSKRGRRTDGLGLRAGRPSALAGAHGRTGARGLVIGKPTTIAYELDTGAMNRPMPCHGPEK
jgi:hypothetical protein